jgi:lipoyl(octanoyl) transferase
MNNPALTIKYLSLQDYSVVFEQMKAFTLQRIEKKHELDLFQDELWVVQHPPVYTQGQAGKPEHVLAKNNIPIIQTDRGGQITYHGPGQIVIYLLLALKNYDLNVRDLVCLQERAIVTVLKQYNIDAAGSREAPGVYVNGQKIASIGLRIKQGFSYHGLALNVDMDLSPFQAIRPCGLFNIQMTQMKTLNPAVSYPQIEKELPAILNNLLKNAEKPSGCTSGFVS